MKRLSLRAIAKNTLLLVLPFAVSLASADRCHALAKAYVTNQTDNTVAVINTVDRTVAPLALTVGTVPFGLGVAVAPAADYFYVVNPTDSQLSQVNLATGITATTFATGLEPAGVAVSPDGYSAYVTNHAIANPSLTAIQVAASTIETITLSGTPFGVAVQPDGKLLYVTDDSADQLLVVDLTTTPKAVSRAVTVGQHPKGVAITAGGSLVAVANSGLDPAVAGTVTLYSPALNTVSATVTVGKNPFGVAITPDDRFAYVTNTDDDSVSVIDLATRTVTATIPVGDGPMGVAVTPNGSYVYVVNNLAGNVSVIATADNSVLPEVIPVGASPVAFGRFIGGPRPAAPTNLRALLLTDTAIALTWTDNASDELGFRVERKKYVQGGFATIATLGPDATSYTDQSLDANANYYYRIRAYNDEGSSDYSQVSYATTAAEESGCFIATAAYGSKLEPQVRLLREFRDQFLTGNLLGRAFVRFYYENSPPLARYIAEHDSWRLAVRCCLLPLVGLAWLALAVASLPGLLVVGSLASLFGVAGTTLLYLKKRGQTV